MGKVAIALLGAGLLYAGFRFTGLAFRLWRVGLTARGVLAALMAALYAASPIDAVPDFFVGIGWVDDLIVLGTAALYIWRLFESRRTGRGARGVARPIVVPQLPPR